VVHRLHVSTAGVVCLFSRSFPFINIVVLSPIYFPMYFFDGENISFDVSLFIYINSINIPPIMIINKIYEHQNLLSL